MGGPSLTQSGWSRRRSLEGPHTIGKRVTERTGMGLSPGRGK